MYIYIYRLCTFLNVLLCTHIRGDRLRWGPTSYNTIMRSGEIVKNTMQLLMAHGRFVSLFLFSGQLSLCVSLLLFFLSHSLYLPLSIRVLAPLRREALYRKTITDSYTDTEGKKETHAHWWLCSGLTIKIYTLVYRTCRTWASSTTTAVCAKHCIFFPLSLYQPHMYIHYNNIYT